MSGQGWLVFLFTSIIHLASILAYTLRIARVRTRKVSISFALFNSGACIENGTFLSGSTPREQVQEDIHHGKFENTLAPFHWLLFAGPGQGARRPLDAYLPASFTAGAFDQAANTISPLFTGFSTILHFVYIDPFLSLLTDDVVHEKATKATFGQA